MNQAGTSVKRTRGRSRRSAPCPQLCSAGSKLRAWFSTWGRHGINCEFHARGCMKIEPSRREFVKAAAAAATVTTLSMRHARAQPRTDALGDWAYRSASELVDPERLLNGHRQAEQREALAAGKRRVRRLRAGARSVEVAHDDGIEALVDGLDAGDRAIDEPDRGGL